MSNIRAIIFYLFISFSCLPQANGQSLGDVLSNDSLIHQLNLNTTNNYDFISSVPPTKSGMYILKRASIYYKSRGHFIYEGLCYDKLAWIFYLSNNTIMSNWYLGKAKSIYTSQNYTYGLGNVNTALGLFELDQNNLTEAIAQFQLAAAYYNEASQNKHIPTELIEDSKAIINQNMGMAHKAQNEYQTAINYFEKAQQNTAIPDVVFTSKKEAIICEYKLGQKKQAIAHAKTLNQDAVMANTPYKAPSYMLLADLYFLADSLPQALQSLDSAKQNGSPLILCQKQYIRIYAQLGNLEKERNHLEALNKAEQAQYEKLQQSSSQLFNIHLSIEALENEKQAAKEEVLLSKIKIRNLILIIGLIAILAIFLFLFFRKRYTKLKLDYSLKKKSLRELWYDSVKINEKNVEAIKVIEQIIGKRNDLSEKTIGIREQIDIKQKISAVYKTTSELEIHQNDLKSRIGNKFPKLTNSDLELIYLILIDKSAHEIAEHFNVDNKSIYTKRYRLRKKLNINKEETIEGFFEKHIKEAQ